MKCNKCGKNIKCCFAGNVNCTVKRHHLCEDCNGNIGLGLYDPCSKIQLEWGPKIGIGV